MSKWRIFLDCLVQSNATYRLIGAVVICDCDALIVIIISLGHIRTLKMV